MFTTPSNWKAIVISIEIVTALPLNKQNFHLQEPHFIRFVLLFYILSKFKTGKGYFGQILRFDSFQTTHNFFVDTAFGIGDQQFVLLKLRERI